MLGIFLGLYTACHMSFDVIEEVRNIELLFSFGLSFRIKI